MKFVDTNIFLRFLINDDPQKSNACEALFEKAVNGEEVLFTTDMVIAEIIWVLESYYEVDKKSVCEMVEKILNTDNLVCSGKEIIISALTTYREKNIDYIDAYNAFTIKINGIHELYSYDKQCDRMKWLNRIEPE